VGANPDAVAGPSSFGAADVEQLESRRSELEQQRFQLIERLRSHGRTLRDLRAQRETVDRQRAGLLSARSIEHVQRELTNVQQKLEQATSLCGNSGDLAMAEENPARASDFLAQLTDGGLVRLMLVEQGRRACVVDREGRTLGVESLTAAQRDQVYLSLCLALVSSAWQEGVRLPLVLDEPFERLDARDTAALAAVLDDFGRRGHQVVVFTGRPAAAERLASVGAAVHDIARLRKRENHPAALTSSVAGPRAKKRTKGARRRKSGKQSAGRRANSRNNDPSGSERSDAA
jgi:uncharacterized protein YhaN